jgi:hypothetical protein
MTAVAALLAALCATAAGAQELEPRAYTAAPVGTTFLLAGIGGSEGAVLFDPSLPVHEVRADLTIATLAIGRTFGLGGRQARVLAVLPIAAGHISGQVNGQTEREPMNGPLDPRLKLSIGLKGAPALGLAEFATRRRQTIVGVSLSVVPPLGSYDKTQLVNLGFNRWAFKPEVGVSRAVARWTLEGYIGVWLFTTNGSYFPGHERRSQAPILSTQGHLSYALTRRAWVALDTTWFAGGQTRLSGIATPDAQRNLRLGATLSIPTGPADSLKVAYSTGATTRRGSDFDTLSLQWQRVWF